MMIKIVQVLFYLTQVYSITVPPVWPDASSKKLSYLNQPTSRPFYQENFKPLTPATPVITHGSFKIPSFFPEDSKANTHSLEQFGRFRKLNKFSEFDAIDKTVNNDELHFRPTVNQNVYIKHPTPQINSPTYTQRNTNSPQSFQIVHFENQTPTLVPQKQRILAQNIYRQPQINRSYQQKPATKQHTIPFVRQHLTEVTAQPTVYVNKQIHPPNALQNYQDEEDSNESLEEDNNEDEYPRDVPVKPIYPGEGQWAKYGTKHRPYIRDPSAPIKVQETNEDERPEGYETFERGDEQFKIAQNKFKHNLATFPQRHQIKYSPANTRSDLSREPLYEKPEIDFVPQKLYTQVRKTESQKHLPRLEIDPEQEENADRLRETVKDSIIHTVYSEEGYEDSAYDHAGHEKKAENSEGHAQNSGGAEKSSERGRGGGRARYSDEGGRRFGKNSARGNIRHNDNSKSDNFADTKSYEKIKKQIENDAEEAGSEYDSKKVAAKIPSKEVKNVVLRNKDQKEINMEILTEIKYTPQLQRHKYVRITPSNVRTKNNTETIRTTTTTTSTTSTPRPRTLRAHKRIKRYDKDILSKRYVRKRPKYYWKRIKINTNGTDRLTKKYESNIKPSKLIPKLLTTKSSEDLIPEKVTKSPQRSTTTPKVKSTTTVTTSTPTTTTLYSITVPPTKKNGIVTTTTVNPNPAISSKSSISPPKLVEELHPDLMNPELTTKSSRRLPPKVPPVKIKRFEKKRPKRYTLDHPKIDVDLKEFINVEELEEPTEKPDSTHIKYPYYTLPITETLNENSPLRYAEDLGNIPIKIEDQMSFYNSKSHIRCPEIPSDVNPIPDRVQDQEEGEETDKMAETPDLPRLEGLGDKIDCLKEKYWGEHPLDSPFFEEEEVVETPIPLFILKNGLKAQKIKTVTEKQTDKIVPSKKPMYHKTRKYGTEDQNLQRYKLFNVQNGVENNNAKKRELKIKILEPIVVIDDELYDAATINPIHQSTEAVLKPPYTLKEMMTMNEEKLTFPPRSIYDKIILLEQNTTTEKTVNTKQPKSNKHRPSLREKFVIVYENQESDPIKEKQPEKRKQLKKAINYDENIQIDAISNLTSLTYNDPKMNASSNIPTPIPLKYFVRTSTPKPSKNLIRKLTEKTIKKPMSNSQKISIKIRPNISSISPTFAPTIQTATYYAIPEKSTISTYKLIDPFPEAAAIIRSTKPPYTQAQIGTTTRPIKQYPEARQNPLSISETVEPSWSQLSTQLSSLYNVFDITQFIPKIPNHRIVTSEVQYKDEIKPSEQMKVYNDVLKTIQEGDSATVLKPVADATFVKNDQKLITTTSSPIEPEPINSEEIDILLGQEENLPVQTETVPQSSHQISELLSAPESNPYQQLYQYYNKYISNPVSEKVQETQPSQNMYYVIGLQDPKLGYRQKREVSGRSSKSHKDDTDEDMMMEESKYFTNVVKIGAEKRTRQKRQIFYQENSPEEDLLMEETAFRPAYSSPPERKQKVYTEIVRSRPARPLVEIGDEEEDEDLNPRKRIYELKSSKPTTESSPEYEDEYVEEIIEETKPSTTTKKPRVFPVEANQKDPTLAQYLFLIDKAHKVWAAEDATSTTPEPQTEAPKMILTQTMAESVNVRRGEPTYLQLINQLHEVRKEIDNTTTSAPTTATPTTTEEILPSVPVRNSNPFLAETGFSNTFLSELKTMQDKLDNDNTAEGSTIPEVSSRTRNFDTKFRTSIDTSKYKTIERAPLNVRHNFSSRFSAQDQLPLSKTQTTQEPTIIAILSKPQQTTTEAGKYFSEADILAKVLTDTILPETFNKPTEPEVTSTERATTTTIKSRGRVRGRARPTSSTTVRPQTSTINPVFRRRRPTLARSATTTTTTISPTPSNPNIRRRSRLKASETRGFVPEVIRNKIQNPIAAESTSEAVVIVTPVPILNNHQTTDEPQNKRRFQKVQQRRVTSEVTLTRYFEPESAESESNADDGVSDESAELEESKKHQYEIIGPLTHTDTKHGGNYRYEHEEDRFADVVHPPESFFSDPQLAVNVNQLKENAQTGTETSSPKIQASNSVQSTDEIEEKVLHQRRKPAHSKVSLYPNMARMINRLAESRPEQVAHAHPSDKQDPAPEEGRQAPAFIKDPSRRMYYYAKL